MSKPFSRLDVNSAFHPKVIHVGNGAWGGFLRLVAHSNAIRTDGRVSVGLAKQVLTEEELVRLTTPFPWARHNAPLMVLDGEEYILHDFHDWNETASEIDALSQRRSAAGKEGAKQRSSNRSAVVEQTLNTSSTVAKTEFEQPVFVSVVVDVADPEGGLGETHSEPDPPENPPGPESQAAKLAAWESKVRDAYCRGIAEGKEGPFAWPGGLYDQGALNECVKTFGHGKHGKPFKGDAVTEWVFDFAAQFANDVCEIGKSEFYSGFSPKGFRKWLNEYHQKKEARRIGS